MVLYIYVCDKKKIVKGYFFHNQAHHVCDMFRGIKSTIFIKKGRF